MMTQLKALLLFLLITDWVSSQNTSKSDHDILYQPAWWSGPKFTPIIPVAQPEDSPVPYSFYTSRHNSNEHDFLYLINQPDLCLNTSDIFLLMLIRTKFDQVERRSAIRTTWGNTRKFPKLNLVLLFLFAGPDSPDERKGLVEESNMYGDVIQENFVETYDNLAFKDAMAFKWATVFCSHAKYVMVGSDEIIVDMYKLLPYLQKYALETPTDKFYNSFSVCYLFPRGTRVWRNHPKYSANKDDYGGKAYPAYCSGTAYIAPSPVIQKLHIMARDTPSFMPDDAWIGVLAEKLGLGFHDTYQSFSGISNHLTVYANLISKDYLTNPVMISVLDYDYPNSIPQKITRFWTMIEHHHSKHRYFIESWNWDEPITMPSLNTDKNAIDTLLTETITINILIAGILICLGFIAKISICYSRRK